MTKDSDDEQATPWPVLLAVIVGIGAMAAMAFVLVLMVQAAQ